MKQVFQVGITGGIGSGKSTVARIFGCLGIPIYDADSHAKKLMTTDGILISAIKAEFGNLSYDGEGRLASAYLAAQVFNNPERLKRLNQLVHPAVFRDYDNWIAARRTENVPYVMKEAALLLDREAKGGLDRIIVVTAPDALRIQRVTARDRRDPEQVNQIMQRQMSQEKMIALADAVIVNDEKSLLIPQVLELHRSFSGMAAEPGRE